MWRKGMYRITFAMVSSLFSFCIFAQQRFTNDARSVYSIASGSVVLIKNPEAGRQGSGVAFQRIQSKEGITSIIATNCHVIGNSTQITVIRGGLELNGLVLRCDQDSDIALLAVAAGIPPAKIRASNELHVGEQVYAIGAPRGLELSITDGIISQLRPSKVGKLIQTSATIAPGSSGGGLFDSNGQLVGLTTSQIKGIQGLNFATPTEAINETYESLFQPKGLSVPNQNEHSRTQNCGLEEVATTENHSLVVDGCSLQRKSGLIWAAVYMNSKLPIVMDDGMTSRSIKLVQVIDCKEGSVTTAEMIHFRGTNGGDGQLYPNKPLTPPTEWKTTKARPGTLLGSLFSHLCR